MSKYFNFISYFTVVWMRWNVWWTGKLIAILHPGPFNKNYSYWNLKIQRVSKKISEIILQLHLYAYISPKNDFHHWVFHNFSRELCYAHLLQIRDSRQISLLILSEFRQIISFLFTLKSSENLRLSDDFRGIKVN